jgi:hypothetical protein
MLSRKILNVSNSLGLLAGKLPDAESKSFIAVLRSELADAADLAVEFENSPLFLVDCRKEVQP